MFLLSAIVIGLLAGYCLGGRLESLERLRLPWWPLVVVALLMQLVIFASPVHLWAAVVPPLYVVSTGLAAAFVVRNLAIPGMPLVALGTLTNLAAILANGGRMPVDGALLARARGLAVEQAVASGAEAANSVLAGPRTRLAWLTDRFLIPPPFPLATVFSVGDVLIGLGVVWVIADAMRPSR